MGIEHSEQKQKNITTLLQHNFKENEKVIIQPLIEEIIQGEWSLIFFNNSFSHAVLLEPATNDFRVQIRHGGTVKLAEPSLSMINQAKKILSTLKDIPLYARVDFVCKDNEFYLLELELIEPALFFRLAPGSAQLLSKILAYLLLKLKLSK